MIRVNVSSGWRQNHTIRWSSSVAYICHWPFAYKLTYIQCDGRSGLCAICHFIMTIIFHSSPHSNWWDEWWKVLVHLTMRSEYEIVCVSIHLEKAPLIFKCLPHINGNVILCDDAVLKRWMFIAFIVLHQSNYRFRVQRDITLWATTEPYTPNDCWNAVIAGGN